MTLVERLEEINAVSSVFDASVTSDPAPIRGGSSISRATITYYYLEDGIAKNNAVPVLVRNHDLPSEDARWEGRKPEILVTRTAPTYVASEENVLTEVRALLQGAELVAPEVSLYDTYATVRFFYLLTASTGEWQSHMLWKNAQGAIQHRRIIENGVAI